MNKRQQFAAELKTKTPDELVEMFKTVYENYNKAHHQGSCSLEAVLYFDLLQITDAINERR